MVIRRRLSAGAARYSRANGLQMVVAPAVACIPLEQRRRGDSTGVRIGDQTPVNRPVLENQVVQILNVRAHVSIFFNAVSLGARDQAVAEDDVIANGAVVLDTRAAGEIGSVGPDQNSAVGIVEHTVAGDHDLVRGVPVADSVVRYAARLVAASRPGASHTAARSLDAIHKYLSYGASPRASQYLVLGGKARAILASRYHVDFADIQAIAAPVLRHRLVLNFHARADNLDADVLVERLLGAVPVEENK